MAQTPSDFGQAVPAALATAAAAPAAGRSRAVPAALATAAAALEAGRSHTVPAALATAVVALTLSLADSIRALLALSTALALIPANPAPPPLALSTALALALPNPILPLSFSSTALALAPANFRHTQKSTRPPPPVAAAALHRTACSRCRIYLHLSQVCCFLPLHFTPLSDSAALPRAKSCRSLCLLPRSGHIPCHIVPDQSHHAWQAKPCLPSVYTCRDIF